MFALCQVNLFGYKSKITQDQFFKYGYSEMKMLLCCDVIDCVKRKHKMLGIHRSLSSKKRVMVKRKEDAGRFSTVAHTQGNQNHYYFERDVTAKTTRVNSLSRDFEVENGKQKKKADFTESKFSAISYCGRSQRKKNSERNQPEMTGRSQSVSSERYRSLEAYERLTGGQAF